MFRILVLGFIFIGASAYAAPSQMQYVNCALLAPEEIFDAIKILPTSELLEMARRCEDQGDMFMIVADEQTDPFERQRYMRFALKAGIASDQFFEAFRLASNRNQP